MTIPSRPPSTCLVVDQDLQPSQQLLPPGTCDCHFHVFPSPSLSQLTPHRSYTPAPASLDSYLAFKRRYGIAKSVLIHPSVYGTDHALFETLLRSHSNWMRGVAAVSSSTDEETIARWHALGTRGTRINALFSGGIPASEITKVANLVRSFKWHLQLCVNIDESFDLVSHAIATNLPVVIDHIGYFEYRNHKSSNGFKNIISLLKEERVWVKLSAPYRLTDSRDNFDEIDPIVEDILTANPSRLVWGSDWPHPSIKPPMVKEHILIDTTLRWLKDPILRKKILVDNPESLYWCI